MDTSSIAPGAEWPIQIRSSLHSVKAVLVIIGPEWIRASDEWGNRRIDDADDWVRAEIEQALTKGKMVIPVLVREARMPPAGKLDQKIAGALSGALSHWRRIVSPLPEDPGALRTELFREYKFSSFQDVIRFMSEVAPGCDIAIHHPRWENIWKTLRVYLTTWDIGHRISDRDIQLAKYLDAAYGEFIENRQGS